MVLSLAFKGLVRLCACVEHLQQTQHCPRDTAQSMQCQSMIRS